MSNGLKRGRVERAETNFDKSGMNTAFVMLLPDLERQ